MEDDRIDPRMDDVGFPVRRVAVHLRSESGPNLSRFALSFRVHGGDVLWLAYVPDGLRRWFEGFADSCDADASPRRPDRVVRLFDAPSPGEIETLLERVRARRRPDEESEPSVDRRAPEVDPIAAEVEDGTLHPTTVLLDIHHLPTLTRVLRSDGVAFAARHHLNHPTPGWLARYVVLRLRGLLQKLRAANLHLLIASPATTQAERAGPLARGGLDAAVLEAIEAEVDLSLAVEGGPVTTGDHQVRVERSRFPELTPGVEVTGWEDVLRATGSWARWEERLERSCPRVDPEPHVDGIAPQAEWIDDTQEEFIRWAEARGWSAERATSEQDRREHWDVAIYRPGVRYRVDVKARGRLRRSDAAPQDRWHWVELRGVVDQGWLFGGQADLIAFQTADTFLLVPRLDLREHVCRHVDLTEVVSRQSDAEYRVYHRRDRAEGGTRRPTGADRGVLTLIPAGRLGLIAWDERRVNEGESTSRRVKKRGARSRGGSRSTPCPARPLG